MENKMHQVNERVLIIDLEATCNDDDSFPIEIMEVIEIGAVIATIAGEVVAQFQSFVKPHANPTLTSFCKQLTGIEQLEVDNAPSFTIAIAELLKFVAPHKPLLFWGSWGRYDEKQIRLECQRNNIENPLAWLEHRNLKGDFAKVRKIRQVGTSRALALAGLDRAGKHHRALDDAINIAKLIPFTLLRENK